MRQERDRGETGARQGARRGQDKGESRGHPENVLRWYTLGGNYHFGGR